ncbi:MAG: hypothetical protein MK171_08000 [Pirellulales bacterium]|nr:hypothetical protein [Pirellulales bacterium]
MSPRLIQPAYACALALSICVTLSACGGKGDRRALEGSVTLDDKPLAAGAIDFFPLPGTRGPTAGGQIVDGRYYIAPDRGTMDGTFRVVITATRKTGKQVSDPTAIMMDPKAKGGMVDEYEQYIPASYNKKSELTAKVTADGPNEFPFALSSQR